MYPEGEQPADCSDILVDDEGHLSLVNRLEEILTDLKRLGSVS